MAKAWRKPVVTIRKKDYGVNDIVSFYTKDGNYYHCAKINRIDFLINGNAKIEVFHEFSKKVIDVSMIDETK